MSRTTQALLKLQQEIQVLSNSAEGESAPADNATIPAGVRPPAEDDSEPVENPRQTMVLPRKETEELAELQAGQPSSEVKSTPIISRDGDAESTVEQDAAKNPSKPDQTKPRKDDDSALPTDEPEAPDAISTVNYGAGFRLPSLSGELARQRDELEPGGLVSGQDLASQVDQRQNEDATPAAEPTEAEPAALPIETLAAGRAQPIAEDDDIFAVDTDAPKPGPFDGTEYEPIVAEQVPVNELEGESVDELKDKPVDELVNKSEDHEPTQETSDEAALFQQSFQEAALDAVMGSTDWAVDEESTPEAAHEDHNGVRIYGPPPADNSIYHPLEELREYALDEPSEADQLNSERSLRSALRADESGEDDHVFWQAKAKKRRAESATSPPVAERPSRVAEDHGESVVVHRRPATAKSFDHWLDKRLDDATVRNALGETVDRIRELYAYATNNSLLMASGKSSKQVYQPAAMTAIQMAEQTAGDVLLIDASLETRTLSEKLADSGASGLAEALLTPRKWASSCHCWRRENLFFMPAGTAPVTSFAASGKAFVSLLDFLHPRYETIIIDGGLIGDPFLPHIAKVCYGALLVTKLATTRMEESTASMDEFRAFGARVLGCLATNAPRGQGQQNAASGAAGRG